MRLFSRFAVLGAVLLLAGGALVPHAEAQERPDRRQTRAYVPPEQLVSFQKDTPFNQFLELINPLFERFLGKPVVDPAGRTTPIGVQISGEQYLDAFEQVLEVNGLTYRETETAFIVQSAQQAAPQQAAVQEQGEQREVLATLNSREIRINAILFNLNLTRVRDLGLRWDALFPPQQQGGGQGGGETGGGGQGQGQGQFFINTEGLFESVDNVLQPPAQITVGRLRQFLNLSERNDIGKTIANPQITVQSGEQGEIQIGQDVPVQTTDFAGNTVTQFFETGIIVDVTPTLITEPVVDTSGAPTVDFIHLDVRVEDSNSQPSSGGGPIINRNEANTQVILVDGEATAIGGLITTQRTQTRVGVPLLKDLPPWFFGLRYIFGRTNTNVTKQELLIVLQAEVVEPIRARAEDEPDDELVDQRRRRARELLRRMGDRYEEEGEFPRYPAPQTDTTSTSENPQ